MTMCAELNEIKNKKCCKLHRYLIENEIDLSLIAGKYKHIHLPASIQNVYIIEIDA